MNVKYGDRTKSLQFTKLTKTTNKTLKVINFQSPDSLILFTKKEKF